jgi:GntR family transcriptional repressor for pyruvate dehydrogenase complex
VSAAHATPRAYEDVVAEIERAIMSGALSVGNHLPGERELAQHYGVSRVVIREAVRNLEARGIVEVRVGSGTYVRAVPGPALSKSLTLWLQLEDSSVLDLYVVRQELEVTAASLAAVHAGPKDLAQMRRLLDEWETLLTKRPFAEDDVAASDRFEIEFHCLLAKASRNSALETLLRAILPLVFAGRWGVIRQIGNLEQAIANLNLAESAAEHSDIYKAIANHDPMAAEFFMRRHMQTSIAIYRGQR